MNFKILMLSIFITLSLPVQAVVLCDTPKYDVVYSKNFQNLSLGKQDWLFRKHDLITRFGPGRIGYNGIQKLQEALARHGTKLVMVPIPTRAIVHSEYLGDIPFDHQTALENYASYLQSLRRIGVLVPNLEDLVISVGEDQLFFARDHHWTPAGAKLIAEQIAILLAEMEVTQQIPNLSFSSKVIGSMQNPGSYHRAAQIICGLTFQPEVFETYETTGDFDLFAEQDAPQIVLVGTSNSMGVLNFNFAGFLREALSRDVLNLAASGGGYDKAISDYLASDLFHQQPPEFLIWEVPGYYSLNTRSFYEDLIEGLER